MTDSDAVLELTLQIGSDPIQGTLKVAQRAPVRFCGWMELARLLERARRLQPLTSREQA